MYTSNYIYGADCGYMCGYILTSSYFFLFFFNWDKQISMPDDYIGCIQTTIYMVQIVVIYVVIY